jgi:site-specific recombinase XerC
MGRSESTRRVRLMTLRSFFGWMTGEPETPLASNPATGINAPMPELPSIEVVSDDTLKAILRTCSAGTKASYVDLRDAAIVRLFLSCGRRRAELAALDVDDLDVRHGELRVPGKGRKVRWVSFGGSKLPLALSRYLRSRRKQRGATDAALFLSTRSSSGHGWRLTGGAVDMMLKCRCRLAGVEPIHPHQLRHTWAHHSKKAGLSDEDLEVIAGWSSPMMVRRYGRDMANEPARDAHRRLAVGDRLYPCS